MKTLLVWLLGLTSLLAEKPAWDPAKTWIFAVGVLKFDDPALTSWPDQGRVDAVMLEAYRQRGVPAEQILFLKNEQATKAQITRRFADFLHRTGPDDMLIFYYAGHGGRDYHSTARPVHFVTYDTESSWSTAAIVDAIERHFKGSQALLTVDCCHSGALAVEAARRSSHIRYGVLTSAQASARSTGNWTFTQCLVDLLRGQPQSDLDGDGAITFEEAARYCDREMAFCENQRVGHETSGGFPKDLVLAEALKKSAARVGELCEGKDKDKWWKVKILAAKGGEFQVTWIGWDKKYDSWLRPDQLRAYRPKSLPSGTPVDIEWDKKWYSGQVLRSELGLLFVHYDGYPAIDDEWLPRDRVRLKE